MGPTWRAKGLRRNFTISEDKRTFVLVVSGWGKVGKGEVVNGNEKDSTGEIQSKTDRDRAG